MYVYSKLNHRKIFHNPNCSYIREKDHNDLGYFYTQDEVSSAGYSLCKYCSYIGRLYKKQAIAFNKFCREKGYTFISENGVISVKTPFSEWKIATTTRGKMLKLYHKNSIYSFSNGSKIFPGYHKQQLFDMDLIKVLEYIQKHDKYRVNNPFESKVFKSKRRNNKNQNSKSKMAKLRKADKKREKRKMIKLVYNIMDHLEQEK